MTRITKGSHVVLLLFICALLYKLRPEWGGCLIWVALLNLLIYLLLPYLLTFLEPLIPSPSVQVHPGKAILITGCDSGFGHELAKRLFSRGLTVFAGCLDVDSPGGKVLKSIESPRLIVFDMDVTKDEDVKNALALVQKHLGNDKELWGIVNNAGIAEIGPVEIMPLQTFRKIFEVNVFGVLRVTQAFLPLIRKSHGRIVITASQASRVTIPPLIAYSMTKHAIASLADGLQLELAQFGVNVSTIEPGFHSTPILDTNRLKSSIEGSLSSSNPELVRAYKGKMTTKLIPRTIKILEKLTSSKIWKVVDAMEDALLSKWPQRVYDIATFKNYMLFYLAITNNSILVELGNYLQNKYI